MRKLAATIAIAAAAISAAAQHPSSTRWQSVETGQFKLIYPDYLSGDAARIASAAGAAIKADTAGLCSRLKKIPVMMSGSSTTSNGYATMFPYMLMLYAKPSDSNEMSTMDWYQNLISHEMRHIAQYNALDRGFTKLAHRVAGSYGWGALQYSVPQWWFEGDAVYAETMTSSCGRGRAALFDMPMQALLLENEKTYSYDKMLHRSYRDFVPSPYLLGYLMVTGARRNHGRDIWEKTAKRLSRCSFWPWAFGAGYRKESGQSLGSLYKSTMDDLRQVYRGKTGKSENITPINKAKKRCFTSYTWPKPIGGGKILCLKSSLSKPQRFVIIDSLGNESGRLGATDAQSFSTDGKVAVYASEVPDIRWSERSYSNIALVEIATGRRFLITKKQKYFSPAISPDGRRIAAVEFTQDRKCSLVILDLEKAGGYTAKEALRMPAGSPEHPYENIRMPQFAGNGKVAYISTSRNSNAIKVLDINTMETQTILPCTASNIYSLAADSEGGIFFASDMSGTCNVFRITPDGQVRQATQAASGALFPSLCGNTLIFSQYTSNGYDIAACSASREASMETPRHTAYMSPLIEQGQEKLDFVASAAPDPSALSGARKYGQLSDPFKYLGWRPDFSTSHISATAYTTNYLGTINVAAQILRKLDPGYTRGGVTVSYRGLFPVFTLSASLGETGSSIDIMGSDGHTLAKKLIWKENVLQGTVSLPLTLSRFNFSQSLAISAGIQLYSVDSKDRAMLFQRRIDELHDGQFAMASGSVSYSWSKRAASRDFKSPLSLSASASRMQAASSNLQAGVTTLSAGFGTRLLLPQTYLTASGRMVRQDKIKDRRKTYIFDSQAFDVSGYSRLRLQDIDRLTAEISFPLGYPDAGIPCLIWIKRLRGSVTGDIAKGSIMGYSFKYASAGAKILADFCALRLNYDLSVGFAIYKGLRKNGLEATEYGLLLSLPF